MNDETIEKCISVCVQLSRTVDMITTGSSLSSSFTNYEIRMCVLWCYTVLESILSAETGSDVHSEIEAAVNGKGGWDGVEAVTSDVQFDADREPKC